MTDITIRRDPGTWLIWIATGLMLGGLALTFYAPSCRIWARVRDGRVSVVARTSPMSEREVERIAARAGWSPVQ